MEQDEKEETTAELAGKENKQRTSLLRTSDLRLREVKLKMLTVEGGL